MNQKIESVMKSISILEEEKAFLLSQLAKGRTMFIKPSFVDDVEREIEYLQDTLIIIQKAA
jgi:hypothetical protein